MSKLKLFGRRRDDSGTVPETMVLLGGPNHGLSVEGKFGVFPIFKVLSPVDGSEQNYAKAELVNTRKIWFRTYTFKSWVGYYVGPSEPSSGSDQTQEKKH